MMRERRRRSGVRPAARAAAELAPPTLMVDHCRSLLRGDARIRGSREHPNARSVARHFEQRETKGVLLGTEHAADQPFLVLRHPMAPCVLHDFEMIRSRYRTRRKVRHAGSANPVTPVALTSRLILLAECYQVSIGL